MFYQKMDKNGKTDKIPGLPTEHKYNANVCINYTEQYGCLLRVKDNCSYSTTKVKHAF